MLKTKVGKWRGLTALPGQRRTQDEESSCRLTGGVRAQLTIGAPRRALAAPGAQPLPRDLRLGDAGRGALQGDGLALAHHHLRRRVVQDLGRDLRGDWERFIFL